MRKPYKEICILVIAVLILLVLSLFFQWPQAVADETDVNQPATTLKGPVSMEQDARVTGAFGASTVSASTTIKCVTITANDTDGITITDSSGSVIWSGSSAIVLSVPVLINNTLASTGQIAGGTTSVLGGRTMQLAGGIPGIVLEDINASAADEKQWTFAANGTVLNILAVNGTLGSSEEFIRFTRTSGTYTVSTVGFPNGEVHVGGFTDAGAYEFQVESGADEIGNNWNTHASFAFDPIRNKWMKRNIRSVTGEVLDRNNLKEQKVPVPRIWKYEPGYFMPTRGEISAKLVPGATDRQHLINMEFQREQAKEDKRIQDGFYDKDHFTLIWEETPSRFKTENAFLSRVIRNWLIDRVNTLEERLSALE